MHIRQNEFHPVSLGFSNQESCEGTKYCYYLQIGENLYCMRWRSVNHYHVVVYVNRNFNNKHDDCTKGSWIHSIVNAANMHTPSSTVDLITKLQQNKIHKDLCNVFVNHISALLLAKRNYKIDKLIQMS